MAFVAKASGEIFSNHVFSIATMGGQPAMVPIAQLHFSIIMVNSVPLWIHGHFWVFCYSDIGKKISNLGPKIFYLTLGNRVDRNNTEMQLSNGYHGRVPTYGGHWKTMIRKKFPGGLGHKGHFCGLSLNFMAKTYPNQ